jgi:hypothetical protein|tara:strand:- start:519 stop:671 length:153 start_codon:yes stop_codon:yes gene_type:complete
MSKYKNLAELNRLADEMFAEFGFHSLTDDEKEKVLTHYISKYLDDGMVSK